MSSVGIAGKAGATPHAGRNGTGGTPIGSNGGTLSGAGGVSLGGHAGALNGGAGATNGDAGTTGNAGTTSNAGAAGEPSASGVCGGGSCDCEARTCSRTCDGGVLQPCDFYCDEETTCSLGCPNLMLRYR